MACFLNEIKLKNARCAEFSNIFSFYLVMTNYNFSNLDDSKKQCIACRSSQRLEIPAQNLRNIACTLACI